MYYILISFHLVTQEHIVVGSNEIVEVKEYVYLGRICQDMDVETLWRIRSIASIKDALKVKAKQNPTCQSFQSTILLAVLDTSEK